MEYKTRKCPTISTCGLNCGLCPRYNTDGISRCPGCGGSDFSSKHPACGTLSCSQRHGLEYCYLCDEYPCQKYSGVDEYDSFITHLNQFKNIEKIKEIGQEAYEKELDEKISILKCLIEDYNDDRKKNLFCISVDLIELNDIKYAMERIIDIAGPCESNGERAKLASQIIQNLADDKGIILKLRKK